MFESLELFLKKNSSSLATDIFSGDSGQVV